jgi:RNA polymerase sigma factor (sigma-70 family)
MSDRRHDFELLQRFTRDGEQSAFTDLVRRHLDLVFATALRKVEDTGVAQEVAQNVFAVLARKAWQFAPDDSLPAWLHKAALLESKSWLRGELGRRRREQTAAELRTTMQTPEEQPAFQALLPLLDEALLSLREKDRTALLLRFYESQSLREVGAAFGVTEDTAQKRVQSALEKVSDFFKRRGFKTASVAAAAAALQHTATSSSVAMVSAVVSAALQGAPPVLVGLGALLARLASMSRVQTAAVSIALVAVPVAFQLNKRHAAGEEVKRVQTQLIAAQNEHTASQSGLDRLRADSATLAQSVAQAKEAPARAAAAEQAFAEWKQKIRARLLAADYLWDDASPFVRIPKAILPELSEVIEIAAFAPPGVMNPYAGELLGLTPTEKQVLEEKLRRVAQLQGASDVYETNGLASGRTLAAKEFKDQAPGKVGPEAEERFAQMLADLRGFLGEDRWPALPARSRTGNCEVLNGMLLPRSNGSVSASVEKDENGIPQAKWTWVGDVPIPGRVVASEEDEDVDPPGPAGNRGPNVYSLNMVGYVSGNAALSSFLPGGTPIQSTNIQGRVGAYARDAVRERMTAWFQEQAMAQSSGAEKP